MLSFISNGSVTQARKAASVSKGTWDKWMADESFTHVYDIIRNPVSFTYALYQLVALKAAQEHLKLLSHPSVKVRTWAIERSQKVMEMMTRGDTRDPKITINMSEVRHIMTNPGVMQTLPEADRKLLTKGPFDFVEGEVVDNGESSIPGETVLRFTPGEN